MPEPREEHVTFSIYWTADGLSWGYEQGEHQGEPYTRSFDLEDDVAKLHLATSMLGFVDTLMRHAELGMIETRMNPAVRGLPARGERDG